MGIEETRVFLPVVLNIEPFCYLLVAGFDCINYVVVIVSQCSGGCKTLPYNTNA